MKVSQAMKAPRRNVATGNRSGGLAGDPGGDRARSMMRPGHARTRLACDGNMRGAGNSGASSLARWVLEEKSFDFGVNWQG
jgi:hypothetical protein